MLCQAVKPSSYQRSCCAHFYITSSYHPCLQRRQKLWAKLLDVSSTWAFAGNRLRVSNTRVVTFIWGHPSERGYPVPTSLNRAAVFEDGIKIIIDHLKPGQNKQLLGEWLHPNEKTLLYIANLWIIVSHWYGKESPIETPNKAEGSTLGSSLMPCWYCLRYQSFPVKRNSQPSSPSSNHWCHIFLRLWLHWSQTCLSWQPSKSPIKKNIYIWTYPQTNPSFIEEKSQQITHKTVPHSFSWLT